MVFLVRQWRIQLPDFLSAVVVPDVGIKLNHARHKLFFCHFLHHLVRFDGILTEKVDLFGISVHLLQKHSRPNQTVYLYVWVLFYHWRFIEMVVKDIQVQSQNLRNILLKILLLLNVQLPNTFNHDASEIVLQFPSHVCANGAANPPGEVHEQPAVEVENSQLDLEIRWYPQESLELHAVTPVHHPQKVERKDPIDVSLRLPDESWLREVLEFNVVPPTQSVKFIHEVHYWELLPDIDWIKQWSEVVKLIDGSGLPIFLRKLILTYC